MRAVVYKSTGSWYVVKAENNKTYNARIKGIFKIDGITSTNPVAVGDVVEIDLEDVEANAVISNIYERSNYISRNSPRNKMQHHIIAANLDQCLIMATLKNPKTSQGFIDRCLVATEAYHISPVIVFNKTDIYKEKEWQKYEALHQIYSSLNYDVLPISMQTLENVNVLADKLAGKTTLVFGHSGVGKSSFINYLQPLLTLKTNEVSDWSGKGMHTTTFAEMFDIDEKTKIIDTPGIREFSIMDIERSELSHYFPEMRKFLHDCRFHNCVHIDEPGCAVKKAVDEGNIFTERYFSYYNILQTINDKDY